MVSAETLEGLSRQVDDIKLGRNGGLSVVVNPEIAVTNGQTVALLPGVNQLKSQGRANLGTNAVTLAVPGVAGKTFYVVNTGTSNQISFAESGAWASDALVLTVDTGCIVLSVSSTEFRKF
jgi:hypothetical protein